MFNAIIIVFKGTTSVIRRIDINTFDLAGEFLFERLERKQVVSEDEAVIEAVLVGNPMRGVVGLLAILQQDARFQLRPVLFPNPGEFEFLTVVAHI